MRVAFTYINEEIKVKIITSFIGPTFEYPVIRLNPHLKRHLRTLRRYKEQPQNWCLA